MTFIYFSMDLNQPLTHKDDCNEINVYKQVKNSKLLVGTVTFRTTKKT